jgi:septation ring formation regulator EzrA
VTVVKLSDHVLEAVQAERALVASRLDELREQAERVRAMAERLDEDVETNARLLRQMDEMLGLAPQLSLEWQHGELRGHRLQEIAVQLLREKKGVGAVVHYRDWYELVVGAGARVAGKDPVATFLTQVARAPGVESVKPRSGLYRLRTA